MHRAAFWTEYFLCIFFIAWFPVFSGLFTAFSAHFACRNCAGGGYDGSRSRVERK